VLVTSTTHIINSFLYKNLGYDHMRDFVPVATLVEFPMYVFVNANSPYKTLDDLIRRAKQEPSAVSFAAGSATQRLMSEMLQQKAGVKMTNVPYKTTVAVRSELAAVGVVDFICTDNESAKGQMEAGRIRRLAVGGLQRGAVMTEVPTLDEAWVKCYDWVVSWSVA